MEFKAKSIEHILNLVKHLWCFTRFGIICTILKHVRNTHGGVLVLVKLHAKTNTPPCVFSTFFNFCKWYQTKSHNASHLRSSWHKRSISKMFDMVLDVTEFYLFSTFHYMNWVQGYTNTEYNSSYIPVFRFI